MRLILGSSSPRRHELLRAHGYNFQELGADIDETSITDSDPARLVIKIARAKYEALAPKLSEPAIVITSDLVVSYRDEIRGKPRNEAEARQFLASYRNSTMQAVCGVLVTNTQSGAQADGVAVATAEFTDIPDEIVEALIEKGNVLKAAGALMLQNPIMKPYIARFEGSIETCLGLPMDLTERLIDQVSGARSSDTGR